MPGYIDVVYNENVRPITVYPQQLCAHLVSRFQISQGAKILDVGCGRGDFLNGFRAEGLDAHGLDREPSGVRVI
jgi:2-polyprenyl-3-methyl-5-hydroxy-6-metoxy-1,4-benzoquinol methylase